MTPANDLREQIFHAAAELADPAQRAAYLDSACAGNVSLRNEIEQLLRHDAGAGSFLSGAVGAPAAGHEPAVTVRAGDQIGPYKLVEKIGEGGFALVFAAEQLEPVRRTVALKIIKPGMDTREVLARFTAERQALALMDHPNIARVFDGGATENGRPYFVMELVKGLPITTYCDQNHLTPKQRLNLFVSVCHAVQHAHQKGIIHRDLKPTNVLVSVQDTVPVAKVIDFGIAKALGQEGVDSPAFTRSGQMIGTPLYMSPEQAGPDGIDIDTRTDIYSLGVLLYELLTGTTPFGEARFKKAACAEIRRILLEEEPPKPSTRLGESRNELASISAMRQTEPTKLTRLVRGDLDWIVMKSLDKDRNRRYVSANGLAQDVERYLSDEPVLAGPPTASYRLWKFVRRNRGMVVAASLILFALVGGIVGTTWGMVRANSASQLAKDKEIEARTAAAAADASAADTRAVLEFVQKHILSSARPKGEDGGLGGDVPLRKAIDTAMPALDKDFNQRPMVEAQLRMTLGTTYLYLGDAKTAAKQYERAHQLFMQHRGPDHTDTLRSVHNLALSYSGLGRRDDALKLFEDALARRITLLGPNDPITLQSANAVADSFYALGRHADALRLQEDTVGRMKTQLGLTHADTLMGMNNLANTYTALRRYDEAGNVLVETLTQFKALRGPDHSDTLSCMTSLANLYGNTGRHDDAMKLREEILSRCRAKLDGDHPEVLKAMNNLAASYAALGRHADALKSREETLARRKIRFGPNHPMTLQSTHGVAQSLLQLDRGSEAIPIIDDCITRAAQVNVDPRLIPWAMDLRLRHFEKTKSGADCRATAEMWEKLNRTDTASLYSAAAMRAVTAAVMKNDPGALPNDVAEQADAAMAWLKKAVAAGYRDARQLQSDKDLDALRARDDFKTLIAEVTAKSEP